MKTRTEKHQIVSTFTEIQNCNFALIVEYKGFTVQLFERLRHKIRTSNAYCQVMKNSLLKIALKDTGFQEFIPLLKGQNAVIYGNEFFEVLDIVNSAKLKVISVILENKMLSDNQLSNFSQIKSTSDLYRKIQLSMLASIRKIQLLLPSTMHHIISLIKNIHKEE